MNKLYKLTFLFLVSSTCAAQQNDSTYQPWYASSFASEPSIRLEGELGLVTSFLNNTLIKNDYWSDEMILNQVNNLGQHNRLGGIVHSTMTYHTGGSSNLFYTLHYKNITGFTGQKELINLALKGNAKQPVLDFEQKNGFQQQSFGSVGIGKSFHDSVRRTRMNVGISLYFEQAFNKISANRGRFETDSSGESVMVSNADVHLMRSLDNAFSSPGLGINFVFTHLNKSNTQFHFRLKDFGVVRNTQYNSAQMIPAFVFSGFDVSSHVNSAGSINIQDSIIQNYFTSDTTSTLRLLPFETSVAIVKPLGVNNTVETKFSYLYFTGNFPLLESNYEQLFKSSNASWRVGARLGGFGWYGINLGLKLPFGMGHQFAVDVTGIESMVSSNVPVNWTGRFGLLIKL